MGRRSWTLGAVAPLLAALLACAAAAPSSGPPPAAAGCLPAGRIAPWAPGRTDGLPAYPTRKTACNAGCDFTTHGDDATDDAPVLQACVDAAAPDGACLVRTGTYALLQPIRIGSGRALRGEGPQRTTLRVRNAGGIAVLLGSDGGIAAERSQLEVASGYTAGSTALTLAAAPPFMAGSYLALTEDSDPALVNATGEDGTCTWCGGPWQQGAGVQLMAQVLQVVGVSGRTVQVDRPLYVDFQSALHPVVLPFIGVVEGAGVERLKVEDLGTSAALNRGLLHFYGCAGCWAQGVEASGAWSEFVELQFSKGSVVRDCYLHDPRRADSGRGYGVHVLFWNSDHLVENNIMVRKATRSPSRGAGAASWWPTTTCTRTGSQMATRVGWATTSSPTAPGHACASQEPRCGRHMPPGGPREVINKLSEGRRQRQGRRRHRSRDTGHQVTRPDGGPKTGRGISAGQAARRS